MTEINWLAVLLATLASFILGAVWFTPLFGKVYDHASGYERKKGQTFTPVYYFGPFVGSLIMALATAWLIYAFQIETLHDALILATIIGIGYAASASFVNAINPKIARPLLYGAVTGGYHIVSILVIVVIVFWMK